MENAEYPLAVLLRQHRNQIAELWKDLIRQLPDSHYRGIHLDEILESGFKGIDALLEYLEQGCKNGIEHYIEQISMKRLEQGFEIREVIQALLLLQRAILIVIHQKLLDDPQQIMKIYLELDDSIRLMVSQFGHRYSSAMNRSIADKEQQANILAQENAWLYQETHKRLEESLSLQRVTSALLQGRTLPEVLNVVCSEAIGLIGAKGSTVFLLQENNLLHVAYSLGAGQPAFEEMPVEGSYTGIAVAAGKAIFSNQPLQEVNWFGDVIDDAVHGGVQSLLVTPLIVKAKIIGALVVINKGQPFNQDDLRVMGLFADQAAMAIENGRLTDEVERIAIIEERNRLARDLHDSVTQSLYGISLYAEAAARLLASNDHRGVDHTLQELRLTAMDALKEMRLLIYELRPPLLEKEGLEAALQARLDAVEGRAGLKTELQVELRERLPGQVEEGYYRIAQEALNNVLKHAQARKVLVSLKAQENNSTLEIRDDGIGFIVEQAIEKGGIGIKSMFERAERMDGNLEIISTPGDGTWIKVEVDL